MTTDYFILKSEGESIIVFRAQSRSETYIHLNNSAASTDMMTVRHSRRRRNGMDATTWTCLLPLEEQHHRRTRSNAFEADAHALNMDEHEMDVRVPTNRCIYGSVIRVKCSRCSGGRACTRNAA